MSSLECFQLELMFSSTDIYLTHFLLKAVWLTINRLSNSGIRRDFARLQQNKMRLIKDFWILIRMCPLAKTGFRVSSIIWARWWCLSQLVKIRWHRSIQVMMVNIRLLTWCNPNYHQLSQTLTQVGWWRLLFQMLKSEGTDLERLWLRLRWTILRRGSIWKTC